MNPWLATGLSLDTLHSYRVPCLVGRLRSSEPDRLGHEVFKIKLDNLTSNASYIHVTQLSLGFLGGLVPGSCGYQNPDALM